ncbi:MAG: hydroxymethylbilane synthase [Holophagaceae bacterium]
MKPVIVGTRGSKLATAQAEFLVEHLKAKGFEVAWKLFTTSGDRWLEGPLDQRGGTGFFTKELEDALVQGQVDVLIHSLKDVAIERPAGIVTACIPEREDPSDWMVMRRDFPADGVVGTSSVRRERMLRAAHPDWRFTWIRGNVPTRVQRVRDGRLRDEPLHATLLAASGLKRLGLDLADLDVRPMAPEELLPAPGQGALLAETRPDRADVIEAFAGLHCETTARCVALERGVLKGLGGGCQMPLGALATVDAGGAIRLRAVHAADDGIRRSESEARDDAEALRAVLAGLGVA